MTSPDLTIALEFQGQTYRGRAGDMRITPRGVQVEVSFEAELPVLPIGARVLTELSGALEAGATAEAPALLCYQGREAQRVSCSLLYSMDCAQSTLSSMIQRQSVRVRPDAHTPVLVRIPGDPPVEVQDVSSSGISLLSSGDLREALEGWRLQLSILLPGHDRELEVAGELMHIRLQGSTIHYGVRFDEARSTNFAESQAALHRYVMRRQAEMCRERLLRRTA